MSRQTPTDVVLDNQCFEVALYEWNRDKSGSDNTANHLRWWALSQRERSEVLQLAQELKRQALAAQEK